MEKMIYEYEDNEFTVRVFARDCDEEERNRRDAEILRRIKAAMDAQTSAKGGD